MYAFHSGAKLDYSERTLHRIERFSNAVKRVLAVSPDAVTKENKKPMRRPQVRRKSERARNLPRVQTVTWRKFWLTFTSVQLLGLTSLALGIYVGFYGVIVGMAAVSRYLDRRLPEIASARAYRLIGYNRAQLTLLDYVFSTTALPSIVSAK